MPGQLVDYRVQDGLAVMELNQPPANTYNYEMMRELDEAILTAHLDEAVHVLIVRGKGEKFFSVGADINMLAGANPRLKYYFCLHANETLMRLDQTPKLVIAALNGHTAGGLEIAMACDIRIARRDATGAEIPLAEGLALERELRQRLFESGDAAEGLAAYVNKTVPRFEGI